MIDTLLIVYSFVVFGGWTFVNTFIGMTKGRAVGGFFISILLSPLIGTIYVALMPAIRLEIKSESESESGIPDSAFVR